MLKKFLVGTLVAVAVAVAAHSALAALDLGPTTLKVGSKGVYVSALQTFVGASPVDGSFGKMTKAKVMAWQASNGLASDGSVGPKTKAAMMAAAAGTTTTGTYPAGCTSNMGYSTTTGQSCAATATNLPAGCTSTVGYSSTTGMKCDGTTTTTVTGPLTGGAGSIDSLNKFTSGIESTVKEARSTNVLGLEVKASSDSDLALKTLSLDLLHSSAGSYRLDRYVDAVSVYMGSTKVGSASATDFSRTDSTSSKTINLSGVTVKAGQKVRLTVVFEAKDSIQSSATPASNDIGATWNVAATALRYQDATGVIMSYDTTQNATVTFQSSTAYDTVTLQSSSLNPNDTNTQVKLNSVSDDVLVGAFKLKAGTDSTDLNVTSIPVKVTITDPANGVTTTTADDVINDIYLKVDGTVYDNYTASGNTAVANAAATAARTATYTFAIDSGDLTISSGSYKEVQIYVKYGSESTKYDAGLTVLPSVDANAIVVENKAGDTVTSPTTAFTGSTMTLLVNGASVTYVSDAYTPIDASGSPVLDGTISVTFKVSNFGDTDITLAETQTASWTLGATHVVNAVSGATADGDGIITSTQVTKNGSNNFVISAGDTSGKTFTLSRKFKTPTSFVRLAITSVDGTTVTNIQSAAH